jgi:bifunctional ADP-heptose synthase (sugar kinase/adenylyltransferase)
MNRSEFARLTGPAADTVQAIGRTAGELARRHGRAVFVTLAEEGLVAAGPDGAWEHVPSLPLRGPIDVVGAGDCVTANLAAALAAGASPREAIEIASVAASIAIHQLGTTGSASRNEIEALLPSALRA